jgi:DNA-binding FrmR family transcriptional regulator
MEKKDRLRRLKSIEGHVRGIERMVEEDSYCIDVLRQLQAVQAALNKLGGGILQDHLHSCVITAIEGEDPGERERVLGEIVEVYQAASRV